MALLLIGLPFLLVLILFALSNMQTVSIGLWPTDAFVRLPLSMAMLAGMALAFLAGGLLAWLTSLAQRRRARRAELSVRLLEEQVSELKSRLPRPLPPPG